MAYGFYASDDCRYKKGGWCTMNMIPVSHTLPGKLIVALLVLMLMSTLATGKIVVANDRYGIRGQSAPELELEGWIDGDGNDRTPLRLSELRGKIVYLYFFQAWCPGCRSHGFPTIKVLTKRFDANPDVAFLAVQTVFEGFQFNTPEKLSESQRRYAIRVPMAHDAGNPATDRIPATMRKYRSGGTPWTVIIDHRGTVIYNQFHIGVEQATTLIQELLQKRTQHIQKETKNG